VHRYHPLQTASVTFAFRYEHFKEGIEIFQKFFLSKKEMLPIAFGKIDFSM